MSSPERELLEKVWEDLDGDRDNYNMLCEEIEELLAQPELSTNGLQLTKQEPLGFKMVENHLDQLEEVSHEYLQGFNDAVLWAEKHHKIGETNE
jgi:hypothetical protein